MCGSVLTGFPYYVLQDPVLLANASANFGNAVTGIPNLPAVFGKGGAARPIVAGSQVIPRSWTMQPHLVCQNFIPQASKQARLHSLY